MADRSAWRLVEAATPRRQRGHAVSQVGNHAELAAAPDAP
jgi:hypothetical protein